MRVTTGAMAGDNWRCVLAIAGGFLVHLSLGSMFSFGNMMTYFTSYIRAYAKPSDLKYDTSVWVLTSSGMCLGGIFIGGYIDNKLGTRLTTLLGCSIMSLGVCLTFFSIKASFVASIFTYGLMNGLGIAIAYGSPMACAMKWLPKNKGLANGLVVAGFGGGAFIFNQVQTAYVNRNNLSPTEPAEPGSNEKYFSVEEANELLERVPSCMLLLAGCYFTMQLVGIAIMCTPPDNDEEQIELLPKNEEDNKLSSRLETKGQDTDCQSSKESIIKETALELPSVTPIEVVKTRSFYTLWGIMCVNLTSVYFLTSQYKAYGQTFIKDDHFLALVGAFASMCNAGGRPLWGKLVDRFSFKATMLALVSIMMVLTMTLVLCEQGGKAMFFLWICGTHLTFCGTFVLPATAVAKAFGSKHFVSNYGLVVSSSLLAGPMSTLLTIYLHPVIGWFGMFCVVSGILLIGWLLTFSLNLKAPDGKQL